MPSPGRFERSPSTRWKSSPGSAQRKRKQFHPKKIPTRKQNRELNIQERGGEAMTLDSTGSKISGKLLPSHPP